MPTAVRPPNIKDLLRNVMVRLGVVTMESVDEAVLATATERRVQQDEQAQEAIDLDAVVIEQDAAVQGGRGITIDQLPGLTPEQLEEVESFLAALDANEDVQNVFAGLGG